MRKPYLLVSLSVMAAAPYLVQGDRNRPASLRTQGVETVSARAAASLKADGDFGGPEFEAALIGAEEVPAVDTATFGEFEIKFNADFTAAGFEVKVFNGDNITQAHLHCAPRGVNGPVIVFLFGNVPGGFDVDGELAEFTMTDANIAAVNANCMASIGRTIANLADLADAAADGLIYANVHSVAHPGGEVRGQLVPDDQDDEEDEDDDGDENEDDDD
jgi:hypothetical protein